jgi:hypothetical protein
MSYDCHSFLLLSFFFTLVIPSEARNLQFLAPLKCRSLVLLGMTNLGEQRNPRRDRVRR